MPHELTDELALSLNERLTELPLPHLSSQEQLQLVDIIECVALVKKHSRSMDENASRFLMFFRHHVLKQSQSKAGPLAISWREIVWAYHSNSQDILVDLVSRQFKGRMLWENARESGMFMWMTDSTALVSVLGSCGRSGQLTP